MPYQVPSWRKLSLLGCSSAVFSAASSPLMPGGAVQAQNRRVEKWLGRLRKEERHSKSKVGEWALRNHDVTPKVRAAVTSQREEGGYSSTRKVCLCHHEGKHLHAAGLSSAPEELCCSDAKRGEPDCVISFLPTWRLLNWNESASVSTQGTNKPWIVK